MQPAASEPASQDPRRPIPQLKKPKPSELFGDICLFPTNGVVLEYQRFQQELEEAGFKNRQTQGQTRITIKPTMAIEQSIPMELMAFVTTLVLLAGFSLALALAVSGPITRLVRQIGWVDKPDAGKQHDGDIPLAGGLIVMCTVGIVLFLGGLLKSPITIFWMCSLIVFAIAFIDDRVPIRARYRLVTQLLAAWLVTYYGKISLVSLGQILGPFELHTGVLGIPLTILCLVTLTNAINMLDGFDGIVGGVLCVSLFALVGVFSLIAADIGPSSRQYQAAINAAQVSAVAAGAIIGFLMLNQRSRWRARAAIFMGDSGSMMFGFFVASMTLYGCSSFGVHSLNPAAAAWILGIPIFDLISAIIRRHRAGVTPMTPDRQHIHHLALALGLPAARAVLAVQATAVLMACIGVAAWRAQIPEYVMGWGFVVLFLGYLQLANYLWSQLEPVNSNSHIPKDTGPIRTPANRP